MAKRNDLEITRVFDAPLKKGTVSVHHLLIHGL